MSRIRADRVTNREGTGAPLFPNGIRVVGLTSLSNVIAGVTTFTSDVSIGGTLTYEDVTNIDAVGLITARSGIKVTTGGIDVSGGGADIVGVITARTNIFLGDSLKHLGDDNTLISFPSNDTITVHTNGSERLRIDSTGRVGLSTVSPAGTLHVQGNQVGAIVAMPANSVDCSAGNYFTKTITGATTFTFDSVPANVEYSFTLEVTLNGSNAITWPASVKWNADTPPAITDGKTQMFMFLTSNGGTRWRGSALVDYVN